MVLLGCLWFIIYDEEIFAQKIRAKKTKMVMTSQGKRHQDQEDENVDPNFKQRLMLGMSLSEDSFLSSSSGESVNNLSEEIHGITKNNQHRNQEKHTHSSEEMHETSTAGKNHGRNPRHKGNRRHRE